MKIVIAGGSGLVGQALAEKLSKRGDDVVILTREPASVRTGRGIAWGGSDRGWKAEIRGASAVVNLAGSGIADKRWTGRRKKELRESRVVSTRALADAMIDAPDPNRTFVSASAVGYYGARGDEELDEASRPDESFLSKLSVEWESEALRASDASRVVVLRIGIVLSTRGGALAKMLPPFRLGAGGRLGSGKQWMSWIHLDDLVAMIEWSIATPGVRGAYNATAPAPVTNAEFTRVLSRTLSRPAIVPVPAFALRALLGEMAGPLLLTGQRVLPERAAGAGFRFQHPTLDEALTSLLR
ncbi:MAG: TIGR01777 family oxidoreductase [Thermoanaerobaculia bacterium]|nr:TIGR01777 family oxidoreductase [Thermoanaerobaculia bacterium]